MTVGMLTGLILCAAGFGLAGFGIVLHLQDDDDALAFGSVGVFSAVGGLVVFLTEHEGPHR